MAAQQHADIQQQYAQAQQQYADEFQEHEQHLQAQEQQWDDDWQKHADAEWKRHADLKKQSEQHDQAEAEWIGMQMGAAEAELMAPQEHGSP